MANELRVLVCVDGAPARELLESALGIVDRSARWAAVHVIDVRGRRDVGVLRRGIAGAGPLPPRQVSAIESAGREHASGVLAAAAAALGELALLSAPGMVRTGEPGREICAAVVEWSASLVVLRASRNARSEPGPQSVGRTARFVLDHAPCPVLLIRG